MGETIFDQGKRYDGYSELRLGQINPDIEGSAERWNQQGRLRRAGKAMLGLVNPRIEAEIDADHTAALKERIATGTAQQAAAESTATGPTMAELPPAPTIETPAEQPVQPPQPSQPGSPERQ